MQACQMPISAPSLLCVCIDARRTVEAAGRLYHGYREDAVTFSTLGQLMMEMEALFDAIGYPQAAMSGRSFARRQTEKGNECEVPPRILPAEEVLSQRGAVATFHVHVSGRQNATWQGQMYWCEQEMLLKFSSALEFLKQVDCCLNQE